jgi:hypothetical protein
VGKTRQAQRLSRRERQADQAQRALGYMRIVHEMTMPPRPVPGDPIEVYDRYNLAIEIINVAWRRSAPGRGQSPGFEWVEFPS